MAVKRKKKRSLLHGGLRGSSSTGVGPRSIRRPRATARAPRLATPRPAYTPPPKPAPTAASVNAATTPGGLSGGTGGYDISSDPAVAAARGLSGKIRANARASALAKRKQAAIEYGSAEGLENVEGFKADKKGKAGAFAETQAAATNNPFSILKQMQHGYDTGLAQLEEDLNDANLFYSGYRGKQLGEAGQAYQLNKYNAANSYRALQTDITDRLNEALLQADMLDAQAAMSSDGGGYSYGPDPEGDPGVQYAFVAGRNVFGRPGPGTVYGKSARPTRTSTWRRNPPLSSGFRHGVPVRGGF